MSRIPQNYHHININGGGFDLDCIVNSPLTAEEMYEFTKKRVKPSIGDAKVVFNDTITSEPGCPNVISLTTYDYKLNNICGARKTSIKGYL